MNRTINNAVTLAGRLKWTKYNLKTMTVEDVLELMKSGTYRLYNSRKGEYQLKDVTAYIREIGDSDLQNQMKEEYVPVVTFNGIWDGTRISQYSNFTALDFDHINTDNEMEMMMAKLQADSCVAAVFKTFKKYRLKAIVMHDNDNPIYHRDMYEQLMNHFGINYLDESCKDLSRKTYLVWDENISVNPNPIPFHYQPYNLKHQVRNIPLPIGKCNGKSPHSIVNILNSSWKKNHPEYWQKGQRAVSIFKCACQLCEYGVPKDMADGYFLKNWSDGDMVEDEILKNVDGAYKAAKYGSRNFY